MTTYTARHVHECFPAMSGTVFFDRIQAGLIPVTSRPDGPGGAYELSLPQLAHVGVVDELVTLGSWRGATKLASVEIDFIPPPDDKGGYAAGRLDASGRLHDQMREAVRYYTWLNFECEVIVDIRHPPADGTRRTRGKRTQRIYGIQWAPDASWYPRSQPVPLGARTIRVDWERQGDIFSTAVINVWKIFKHCEAVLGLGPDVDLKRVYRNAVKGLE